MPFKRYPGFQNTRISLVLTLCAALVAVLAVAGWLFQKLPLLSYIPGGQTIKMNAALAALFVSISLLLAARGKEKLLQLVFAIIAVAIGGVSLFEYLIGFHSGLNELVVEDHFTQKAEARGQLSVIASFSFTFLGLSIILRRVKKIHFLVREIPALLVFLFAYISLIGYLFNAHLLNNVLLFSTLSLPTTIVLLTLSLAVILYNPAEGIAAPFDAHTFASTAGSRNFFFVVFISLALGWLTLRGEKTGLWDSQFSLSIMIILSSVLFFFAGKNLLKRLNQSELLQERLYKASRDNEAFVQGVLSSLDSSIAVIDKRGAIVTVNQHWKNFALDNGISDLNKIGQESNYLEVCHYAMQRGDSYAAAAWEGIRAVIRNEKENFELQYPCHAPDKQRWFQMRVVKLRNDTEFMVVSHTDITKIVLASQLVEQSEMNLQQVMNNTSELVCSVDIGHRILFFNKKFGREYKLITGMLPRIGMIPYQGLGDTTGAFWRKKADEAFLGAAVSFEQEFAAEGFTRYYDVNLHPIRNNGKVEGVTCFIRNISTRKQAELLLNKAYNKLYYHINNTPLAIIEWDENDCISQWNKRAEEIFGWTALEALGKPLQQQLVYSHDLEKVTESVQELKSGQVTGNAMENRNVTKDGRLIWCRWYNSILPGTNGKFQTTLSIVNDITARKLAEQALQKSEINYRKLFHSSPLPMWIFEIETLHILDVNEAALATYGYSRDEFLALSVLDLRPEEEKQNFLKTARERFMDKSFRHTGVWKHRKKDGTLMDVEIDAHWIDYMDRQCRMVAVRNVTEKLKAERQLAQSEAKYRDLVENIQDMVCTHDLKGKILSVNHAATKMLGFSEEQLVAMNVRDLLTPNFRHLFRHYIREVEMNGSARGIMYVHSVSGDVRVWEYYNTLKTDGVQTPIVRGLARDITERSNAEKKLASREERYRNLINQSNELIQSISADGKIKFANPAWYRTLEYSPDEVAGLSLADLLSEDQRDHCYQIFGKVLQGDVIQDIETVFLSKTGNRIYVQGNIAPEYSGDNVVGTQGFFRDVTDAKKAELLIRESEERFRTLVEQASDGIVVGGPDGRFFEANEAATRMFGYSREEFLQKGISDVILLTGNEPPLRFKELREGKQIVSHRTALRKDGTTFMIELNSKMLPNGNYLGFARDITESLRAQKALAESEEKLRTIFNSEPECVKLVSPSGEIMDMNPAGLAMLEADSIADIRGKKFSELLLPAYREGARKMLLGVFNGESVSFEFEFKGLKGGHRSAESRAVPMKNSEGKIIYMLAITRDVTERKKAEALLRQSDKKLREITASLSGVLYESVFHANGTWSVTFISDGVKDFLGITPEEIYSDGSRLWLGVHPEDIEYCFASLAAANKDTAPLTMIFRVQNVSGGYMWVRSDTIAKRIEGGSIVRTGSFMNITDTIEASQKVEESENRYRYMVERNPAGIYQTTPDGKIISCNEAFAKILGYEDAAKLLNHSAKEFYFSNDDREEFVQLLFANKELNNAQIKLKHKNGSAVYCLENSMIKRDPVTGAELIEGVLLDITSRVKADELLKTSEKKFRDLLDSTPDAMIIADENGKIVMLNKQAISLFGYKKDEITGKPVQLIVPEGLGSATVIPGHKRPKGRGRNQAISILEISARNKEGQMFPAEISLSPLITEEGLLLSAAIRDISSRKKAEKELEESYRAIRELTDHLQNIREEERAHIAREIHDELGQQLTVMMMDVSWISRKIGAENTVVSKKLQELISLLDGMVKSVRRISTELRPSVLDDLGLLAAMEVHLKDFGKRSGIKTNQQFPATEPLMSDAVKNGLYRIFQESLTNVARHSRAKAVSVKLKASASHILLIINDDGVGFDEELAASKKTLGVLGMKERAAAMNGSYTITGKSGMGTTIEVEIPLKGHA